MMAQEVTPDSRKLRREKVERILNRCLICDCKNDLSDMDKLCSTPLSSKTRTKSGYLQSSLLSNHLHVIFIFRTILELPPEKLVTFLQKRSSIDDWTIRLCPRCFQLVTKCKILHDKIVKILSQLTVCKMEIVKIAKDNCSVSGGHLKPNASPRHFDIIRETREFVSGHEYKLSKNSFLEGDLIAEGKLFKIVHSDNLDGDKMNIESVKDEVESDIDADPEIPEVEIADMSPTPLSPTPEMEDDQQYCDDEADEDWNDDTNGDSIDNDVTSLKSENKKRSTKASCNLKCSICSKVYSCRRSLTLHTAIVHKKQKTTCTCDICGKGFIYQSLLKRHMNRSHAVGRKEFLCTEEGCEKVLTRLESFRAHMASHGKGTARVYPCKFCGKEFYVKSSLDRHVLGVHDAKSDPSKLLQCDQCNFRTVQKSNLQIHQKQMHGPGKDGKHLPKPENYPCTVCNEIFTNKVKWKRHLWTQHGIKKGGAPTGDEVVKSFVCDICGASFETKFGLQAHQQKTLKCKRLHMSESEATVICEICGERYSCKENLRLHIRERHEKRFSFNCEQCGKGFSKQVGRGGLGNHLAKVHAIGKYDQSQERIQYNCEVEGCGKSYFKKESLVNHVAQAHTKEEPRFKCDECGKGYHIKSYLYQHTLWVHRGYKPPNNSKGKYSQ